MQQQGTLPDVMSYNVLIRICDKGIQAQQAV